MCKPVLYDFISCNNGRKLDIIYSKHIFSLLTILSHYQYDIAKQAHVKYTPSYWRFLTGFSIFFSAGIDQWLRNKSNYFFLDVLSAQFKCVVKKITSDCMYHVWYIKMHCLLLGLATWVLCMLISFYSFVLGYFMMNLLMFKNAEFQNRVSEFIQENSPEHWKQKNWYVVFNRRNFNVFYCTN